MIGKENWRSKQKKTPIFIFQRNFPQDWGIFVVNCVHIIPFEAFKRQTPVLNFPKKVQKRHFLTIKIVIKSFINYIRSIFRKLWILKNLWERFTIFELFCRIFFGDFFIILYIIYFKYPLFVHLNFILFVLKVSTWIINQKFKENVWNSLNTEIARNFACSFSIHTLPRDFFTKIKIV